MIDPPSVKSGSAIWTVKSSPLTLMLKTLSKWSSAIDPSGVNAGTPALANRTSRRLSLAVRKLLECFAFQDGPGHVAALGGQVKDGRDHIGWANVRLVGGGLAAGGGLSPVQP